MENNVENYKIIETNIQKFNSTIDNILKKENLIN